MAGLRSRPPKLDSEAFIAGAETPLPTATPTARGRAAPSAAASKTRDASELLPWLAPSVRDDVTRAYNLRLPEPLKLKLDYIRTKTRVPVHEFIMNALEPAVEEEIARLEREGR